jgi:hypothetical protein
MMERRQSEERDETNTGRAQDTPYQKNPHLGASIGPKSQRSSGSHGFKLSLRDKLTNIVRHIAITCRHVVFPNGYHPLSK